MTGARQTRQDGFTLIELMVAMTVGMLLLSIVGGLYFDAVRTAEILVQRLAVNQQAREMMSILALGGYRKDANISTSDTITEHTIDNHNYIFGIRGRSVAVPPNKDGWKIPAGVLAEDASLPDPKLYRLALSANDLSPTDTTKLPLMASEAGIDVSVICGNDNDDPVDGCISTQTRVLRGYLRRDIELATHSDAALYNASLPQYATRRVLLMTVNPTTYNLARNLNRTDIADSDIYDVYWTAFRPMVEANP